MTGGRALVVRESLANRWIDTGLIELERFTPFKFGNDDLRSMSFSKDAVVAPVNECPSPNTRTESLAFALALKASRAIDGASSFQDAIYLSPLSRLLPTYTTPSLADDALLLGSWLTGGIPISINSFSMLSKTLSWLPANGLKDVITAAGFDVAKLPSHGQNHPVAGKAIVSADGHDTDRNEKSGLFILPGRPDLEAFFREHVIAIIENSARYQALGIGFPAAIVLHGPPGCGKTFAVEQLIKYLGWPSFQIDASSVASPYIHETSRKVAKIFDLAAQAAPSVLVIDEMEAFLTERNTGSGQHQVEEVAEFLRRIPEAVTNKVLIIAMTNRLEMIDQAILRRGRFDHIIEVGPASEIEIEALLKAMLKNLPKDDDVDPAVLAKQLGGRPLSDVAFVVREAARVAARDGKDSIAQENLVSATAVTPARNQETQRRIGFN